MGTGLRKVSQNHVSFEFSNIFEPRHRDLFLSQGRKCLNGSCEGQKSSSNFKGLKLCNPGSRRFLH